MDLIGSIDFSLSKEGGWEVFSLTDATFGDALEHDQEPISNEQILPDDVFLDTYVVTSEAHSGNMGSVWRVHHRDWDTDLAMKRPKPQYFAEASDERKRTFVAECENWINLGLHPHVVSCHYVRLVGGVPTVFAEWMDGGSLEDAIASRALYDDKDDAVTQERILDIAIQMARGLQYSHARGLLHQDVKPANVMLTGAWEAKVGDFGLAKAVKDLADEGDSGNRSGGTLAYCPREQAEGQPAEPWMDAYAWALTVLEMYAGERLWGLGSEVAENVPSYFPRCRVNIPMPAQILLVRCIAEHVSGFANITMELERAYRDVTGKPYPRPLPQAASDTADSLSNRALSFLDLGKRDVAQALWQLALERNPDATYALYNSELSRLVEQGESITDVYELETQRNELHGKVLDSSSKSETHEKDLMLVRTELASYSNFAEHFMKKALDLCPAQSPERPRYEELYETIRRSWLMLPADPKRCGTIAFDRDGDLVAICWLELIGGDSSCLSLAVCDLRDKGSLRKRRLEEFWDDRGGRYFGRLRRVYFVNGVITLLSDGFGYAQYDPATLELVAEGDDDPPFDEPWRDDWPYMPLADGLRRVLRTNEDVLWGNFWTRERGRRGSNVWMGTQRGNERDCCLHADFPAQGLPRGFYAVCADHEGRYLLIYHENPMTTAAAPEFYLADTTLFGCLPEYAVAHAASYRETIDSEEARRKALARVERALREGDVATALANLDEVHRLFPDEPGDAWTNLNDEVGRYAVRDTLYGVRTGPGEYTVQRERGAGHDHPFEVLGGDDPLSSYLALGEGASKERFGTGNEERWERFYRIAFERAGDAGTTVTAPDGSTIQLPVEGFHKASGAAYDRGQKVLYTCANGELVAWDVSAVEPRKTGSVRFGRTIAEDWDERLVDGLLPYDPSDQEQLWTLDPYRIILNRRHDATALLLRSKLVNVYGRNRRQDLEMMTVIDLRTMAVVHSEPCHPQTWVLFEDGQQVARSLGLVGLSDDGTLMAIDHDEYGAGTAQLELWDVAEPGTFVKHIAQTFETCDGLRGDGGALLCGDRTSLEGDVETHYFKEQLLDWRYRLPRDPALREQKLAALREHIEREAQAKEQARAEREARKRELRERLAQKRGQQAQGAQAQATAPHASEPQDARAEMFKRNPQLAELSRKAHEARERAERERARKEQAAKDRAAREERERAEREREAARKAEQERQAARSKLMATIIEQDGRSTRLQAERENLQTQIEAKAIQLSKLGFFQGKKKRELAAQIDGLKQRLAEIPAEIAEAEAKSAEARAKLAG